MTRIRALSAATLFLTFAATSVTNAQGKGDKQPKPPKEQKAAPATHAEKPTPAPHVEKAAHVAKPASVHNLQKQAPVQHVKATPVQHVQKPAPAPHAQKVAPVARVQKPAPVAHLAKRELVVTHVDQQKRVKQQQQYYTQYRRYLDQQNKLAVQRENQVLKQNRKAYNRFLHQYYARLAQQQRQLLVAPNYSDPYYTSPYVYQYAVSGYPRYTNQYGADILKQGVDYGYQQGYQAGQADRQDGWAANYRSSYAYTDANYGYTGNYVSQSDYNYYFRQGFQKGYSDGYYSRSQYGNSLTGSQSILSTVLSAILGLTNLR